MLQKTFHLRPFNNIDEKNITIKVHVILKEHILSLNYIVEGDLDQLLLPKFQHFSQGVELWKSTCFEYFMQLNDDQYIEFNFSPLGFWDIYTFESYRKTKSLKHPFKVLFINTKQQNDIYQLDTAIHVATMKLKNINLTAIIDHKDSQQSFWAVKHNPVQPDFHHPIGFFHFD